MTTATPKSARPRKQRRTQEERRAETSGKLLNATIDLLLEKGYSRFRIAEAAARANVSRGGQTHHFSTKNELVEAAITQLFDSEVNMAQAEAANTADADIVSQAARHADEFLHSKLYQVSLNMLISAGELEHLADGVRAISARSRAPIEQAWIERFVRAGIDPENAEAIISLLWSVQRGLAVENRIGGDTEEVGGNELAFAVSLIEDYVKGRWLSVPTG